MESLESMPSRLHPPPCKYPTHHGVRPPPASSTRFLPHRCRCAMRREAGGVLSMFGTLERASANWTPPGRVRNRAKSHGAIIAYITSHAFPLFCTLASIAIGGEMTKKVKVSPLPSLGKLRNYVPWSSATHQVLLVRLPPKWDLLLLSIPFVCTVPCSVHPF